MDPAAPLFSEQVTHRPQPRYGELAPMRAYMHLKITFDSRDKLVQDSFRDGFTEFMNRYIEDHDLPLMPQEVLLREASSGFSRRRVALKTELLFSAHLDDQQFRDFVLATQELLQRMPHVVGIRCDEYHHHVVITATGIEVK